MCVAVQGQCAVCGRPQNGGSQDPQRARHCKESARYALWRADIKHEAVHTGVGAAVEPACEVEAGELSNLDAGKQGESLRLALREVDRHSQLHKPRGHLEQGWIEGVKSVCW